MSVAARSCVLATRRQALVRASISLIYAVFLTGNWQPSFCSKACSKACASFEPSLSLTDGFSRFGPASVLHR